MPSSYVDSIAPIVKLLVGLAPQSVIDVGPGWGKYGLLCREYLPSLRRLWAVEVEQGRLATQDVIYDQVLEGDVRGFCQRGSTRPWQQANGEPFDVALLIDVIEHMPVEDGHVVLNRIQALGCKVLVSTPQVFIEQHDPANPYEDHVSQWRWEEFAPHRVEADASTIDSVIYLLPSLRL